MARSHKRAALRRRARRGGAATGAAGASRAPGSWGHTGEQRQQALRKPADRAGAPAAAPLRRLLWWCGSAVFLAGIVLLGTVAASAVGWAGTPGVFTARECHPAGSGKGGKGTTCSGLFVAEDGSLIDTAAALHWAEGRAGGRIRVRALILGGYQRESALDAALVAVLIALLAAPAIGCAFAGLSRCDQDRLAALLPGPVFKSYVRWRS
ncbi:hypothetical protein ACIOC2_33585 [Streptomyces sp. NPDC088337]|uniref:hypothetical protein n=1 Tax=unclassified Streptomyces TaxID=2593676 RepID=UPI002DDA34CC|nr:hypothetical protein [Streptomyces sp. NBC_01788]WSB30584.1 hypothetical protein OIE49_34585 [Streptomyces sp. NBC_01788]